MDRCDLAIWDVGGALTGELRDRLENVLRRDGPKIAVAMGDLSGSRIVVAWPQRVIARHASSIAEAVVALRAAHSPRRWLVVGPAAAVDRELPVGACVVNDGIGVGTCRRGEGDIRVTTDWGERAVRALADAEMDGALMAVVTSLAPAGAERITPPVSRRRTLARQAGALLGGLLTGSPDANAVPSVATRGAARAIDEFVRGL